MHLESQCSRSTQSWSLLNIVGKYRLLWKWTEIQKHCKFCIISKCITINFLFCTAMLCLPLKFFACLGSVKDDSAPQMKVKHLAFSRLLFASLKLPWEDLIFVHSGVGGGKKHWKERAFQISSDSCLFFFFLFVTAPVVRLPCFPEDSLVAN